MKIQLNKEIMNAHLYGLCERLLELPEVLQIQIRDIIITKGSDLTEMVAAAMDAGYHDCLSDVDLSVKVGLSSKDMLHRTEYMKHIERFDFTPKNLLGISFIPEQSMYRIVQKNGMRYDFGFSFEMSDDVPVLDLGEMTKAKDNPNWPMENVNRFWFVLIQALGKLYRKDFLISNHLANICLNETLVQQMVLRDIQYGTNHHRYGYEEENAYLKHKGKCTFQIGNDTFNLIADKLYCAAITYDELTALFYRDYEKRSPNLFEIWKCYNDNSRI